MLPVIDPDGRRAGRQAVLYAAALVPVSLVPTFAGIAGAVYFGSALVLGVALLVPGGALCRGAKRERRPGAVPRLDHLSAARSGSS